MAVTLSTCQEPLEPAQKHTSSGGIAPAKGQGPQRRGEETARGTFCHQTRRANTHCPSMEPSKDAEHVQEEEVVAVAEQPASSVPAFFPALARSKSVTAETAEETPEESAAQPHTAYEAGESDAESCAQQEDLASGGGGSETQVNCVLYSQTLVADADAITASVDVCNDEDEECQESAAKALTALPAASSPLDDDTALAVLKRRHWEQLLRLEKLAADAQKEADSWQAKHTTAETQLSKARSTADALQVRVSHMERDIKDAAVRATAAVAALEARLTETKAELVTAREEYALKLADTGQDAFSWFKDQAAKERARNDELQSERDAAVTELAVMREAAMRDAARAAKAEREAQDAREQLEPVQTELAYMQAEAEAASKRAVEAESQIESAQKSAQEAREAAASAALQVEELKQQMAALKEEASAASARADGLDGKLQAAQLQHAAMQTAHDSELAALNARVAALVQELDSARNEAAEWKAKYEHLHEHAVEPEHATALKQALQTERDARVLFQMEARAAAAVIAASTASPASGGSGIKTRMAASPGALTAAARLFPQTSPQASAMVGVSTPVAALPSGDRRGLQRAAAATSG